MMEKNPKIFIGLDIGDGESSIGYIYSKKNKKNTSLNKRARRNKRIRIYKNNAGKERTVTAVSSVFDSEDREYSTHIGIDALLNHNSDGCHELNKFIVNFKSSPTSGNWKIEKDSIKLFTETFLGEFFEKIEASTKILEDGYQVIVGCPTGWDDKDIKVYEKCLQGVTYLEDCKVIRESLAALLYSKKQITKTDLKASLVIDIGSSTTDVSFISYNHEKSDYVTENITAKLPNTEDVIGAQLIDQAIKEHILDIMAQSDESVRSRIRGRSLHDYLLYLSRIRKESLFKKEKIPSEPPLLPLNPSQDIINEFWEKLKTLKLRELNKLNLRGKYGHTNWRTKFKTFLKKIHTLLPNEPRAVFLTGGGSLMPFTQKVCTQVFPNSKLVVDSNPLLSVVKGLSEYGYDLNQEKQRKYAESIPKDILPSVEKVTKEYLLKNDKKIYSKLFNRMLIPLSEGIIENIDVLEQLAKEAIICDSNLYNFLNGNKDRDYYENVFPSLVGIMLIWFFIEKLTLDNQEFWLLIDSYKKQLTKEFEKRNPVISKTIENLNAVDILQREFNRFIIEDLEKNDASKFSQEERKLLDNLNSEEIITYLKNKSSGGFLNYSLKDVIKDSVKKDNNDFFAFVAVRYYRGFKKLLTKRRRIKFWTYVLDGSFSTVRSIWKTFSPEDFKYEIDDGAREISEGVIELIQAKILEKTDRPEKDSRIRKVLRSIFLVNKELDD